ARDLLTYKWRIFCIDEVQEFSHTQEGIGETPRKYKMILDIPRDFTILMTGTPGYSDHAVRSLSLIARLKPQHSFASICTSPLDIKELGAFMPTAEYYWKVGSDLIPKSNGSVLSL